ncbi:exported hypothetical protein [Actinacidiphila bryophytorum]|uniref:Uncharacterized protein n=1 Tax=Actinacidiphila bryophytorum TaxID=1436133 RepID=A0A9W4E3Q5_9ACTN|nr:exported hypothetical protein [Actinacidiphila bryophytorum]
MIMKQVWVNSASCSAALRTTIGALLPTEVTAMPEPKSISRFPSTSSTTPPPARRTYTGSVTPTPSATAAAFLADNSCDFGPGTAVTSLRSCGNSLMTGILLEFLDPAPSGPSPRLGRRRAHPHTPKGHTARQVFAGSASAAPRAPPGDRSPARRRPRSFRRV